MSDQATMNELVSRLVAAQAQWNAREDIDDEIVAHPPATASELAAWEQAAGHPPPPLYAEMLRVHDGIEGVFGIAGELLSSGYRGEYDAQWADCASQLTDCPPLGQLVFFAMDDDGSAAAFDNATRTAEGEMQVVEIVNYREVTRFESLRAFLLALTERLEAS